MIVCCLRAPASTRRLGKASCSSAYITTPASPREVVNASIHQNASSVTQHFMSLLTVQSIIAVADAIYEQVRELSEAKLAAAVDMEVASYPSDEAASPEGMRFRRANAGAFFLEGTLKSVSHDIRQ